MSFSEPLCLPVDTRAVRVLRSAAGLIARHQAMVAAVRQAAGFSLIEAMVVVSIISVLSMLAAPSFNNLVAGQRASNAASDLQVALIKTRSEATKRNANVTMSPNAGGWKYGWKLLNPVDSSVIDAHDATAGLTITGPSSVTYQGSGRIQGSAPSFLITSTALDSVQRCVSVDLSGRPYVKKTSC